MKTWMRWVALAALVGAAGCERDGEGTPSGPADTTPAADASGGDDAAAPGDDVGGPPGADGSTGAPAPLFDRIAFESETLVPESGDFDPTERAFYVGSARHGEVVRVDADGQESGWFTPEEEGWSTLGIRVDAARRRLWVCAADRATTAGALWGFDLESGARVHAVDLSAAAAGASCNDVVVAPGGEVYITDRENPHVYRYDAEAPEGERLSRWAEDPRLTGLVGLNGLAFTTDGQALLVGVYLPPALYRISLADPTDIEAVELVGDPFAGGAPLAGADGMRMHEGALYVAMEDRLARLEPDDDAFYRATVHTTEIEPGTSAVIVAEGALYGVKGDIVAFVLGQPPRLPFELYRLAD